MMPTVAVLGATGFVGSHVVRALTRRDVPVRPVRAPRLTKSLSPAERSILLDQLQDELQGVQTVINAAGAAQATGSDDVLMEANHLMPTLVAEATSSVSVRFVHISSAAVQGRRPVLDSSPDQAPFSPYSFSKAAAETSLLGASQQTCIYRPPGVHGRNRRVTRTLVRLASSPFATVAAPGTGNTPQALVENVADAVAYLATVDAPIPQIVHHPSEGLTTAGLMTALGGRSPRRVPSSLVKPALRALNAGARVRPGLEGQTRRLEMLWFGQEQAKSWLDHMGWRPPSPLERWEKLGHEVRADLDLEQDAVDNGRVE